MTKRMALAVLVVFITWSAYRIGWLVGSMYEMDRQITWLDTIDHCVRKAK